MQTTKLVVVAVTNPENGEVHHVGYFGQSELVDMITAGAKEDETASIAAEFEVTGLIACSFVNHEDAVEQGLLDDDDDDDEDEEDNDGE